MNNKLNQVFIGEPLTQKQIAKWERMRRKGKAMYVAQFTLWCGTMTFVVTSLGLHYLNGVHLRAR
jgi:hypothetical protein